MCHNPPLSGPETMETVVCVPVPMQMSSGHGTLFEHVTQETLGEVVASCPVQGVMQGSQVIIIAGPGYDALTAEGIQLNVTSTGGEELSCAMIEGVAAYTQAEPENEQLSSMDSMEYIETKKGSFHQQPNYLFLSRPGVASMSVPGKSLSSCPTVVGEGVAVSVDEGGLGEH